MTHAAGTFDVKLVPQADDGDATLGRLSIDKQFHGDLEGTSRGQMLTAGTDVEGSAGYVAMERGPRGTARPSRNLRPPAQRHDDAGRSQPDHSRGAGLGHRGAGRTVGQRVHHDRRGETLVRFRVLARRRVTAR